jgi:DNA-directed RNA polymerase specialized sigma24 family protein
MTTIADLKQLAALKTLRRGKLDPAKPYSGAYYRSAYRTTKLDACRRQSSQDRRVSKLSELSSSSQCLERYSSDRRYDRRGLNSDDPAKIAEVREELDLLHQSIKILAPKDQKAIDRCDLREESVGDVARDFGKTKCAVRSRRFQAHQRLCKHLRSRGVTAA